MPKETELIKRIKQGDKAAFDAMIDDNIVNVRALALSLTRNPYDADDIAQEVFLKAYKGISGFRNDCRIGTWLYRITINTFLNMRKRNDFYQAESNPGVGKDRLYLNDSPISDCARSDINEKIENALCLLTPRERTVFVLRHYEDISIKEIAFMLAVSMNSVKTLLRRAAFKLKNCALAVNRSNNGRNKK